jgi:hypothetical protein
MFVSTAIFVNVPVMFVYVLQLIVLINVIPQTLSGFPIKEDYVVYTAEAVGAAVRV